MIGIGWPTAWHIKIAKSLSLPLTSVFDMTTGLTINYNDDKIMC